MTARGAERLNDAALDFRLRNLGTWRSGGTCARSSVPWVRRMRTCDRRMGSDTWSVNPFAKRRARAAEGQARHCGGLARHHDATCANCEHVRPAKGHGRPDM